MTSLKVTFNNGRKDYISPCFGKHDSVKDVQLGSKVKQITACHFQDCTCFLMINEDAEKSFGAARMDIARQAVESQFALKETQ